ncbi:unnamed protein product [Ostreobium quekettii]|uniref:Glyoxalase/fosfomycin resistance/dioxygenase domain-containing protein n=1 Tax=Ostreobium quekettii TaxID=121088 RepID=A0A8S1JB98_9CHLO|nr:unnamed protein product [Ostreobium quekettii]|eukprot:evm.model.scf_186.5 EVM.evm.TU.scf_186.5   scf_186:43180-43987(+)
MPKRHDEEPVKDEYPKGVVPCIVSPDCAGHMEWMKRALGAEADGEVHYMPDDFAGAPGGNNGKKPVMHAPMRLNGGPIYMSDNVDMEKKAAVVEEGLGRGYVMHLNVPDAQAMWDKALAEGASAVVPLKQQYWGDLYGVFKDPFGYQWSVCPAVDTSNAAKKQKADGADA